VDRRLKICSHGADSRRCARAESALNSPLQSRTFPFGRSGSRQRDLPLFNPDRHRASHFEPCFLELFAH
jgi:hypothetical protein